MPVQGGFSEVQLARDRHTGKTVALKIVFLNKSGLTAEQVSKPIDVHCLCTCLECPSPRAQLCYNWKSTSRYCTSYQQLVIFPKGPGMFGTALDGIIWGNMSVVLGNTRFSIILQLVAVLPGSFCKAGIVAPVKCAAARA
jgi:hypothetical protein